MKECVLCKTLYQKGSGVTFHKFPTDNRRLELWLKNIEKPSWRPKKYDYICSKHFSDDCFIKHNSYNSTATTVPKLDFWSPDPKFDIIRSQENRRQMRDENENKIYYKHNHNISIHPRYAKYTDNQKASQKPRPGLIRSRYTEDHTNHQSRKPLPNILRIRDDGNDNIWPKPKRVRHRSRNTDDDGDGAVFSTRMTPMYLMQQPNERDTVETTTQKHKTVTEEILPSYLSPYSLEKHIQWMLSHHKDVNVTIESIGRTVEYNKILLVKLSEQTPEAGKYFRAEQSKYIEEKPEKKIVFIVHGLSVIGITSLATLSKEAYFSTLLSYYISHLDTFDIFLIPMANPDGYAAAAKSQFWNKNMSPQKDCEGVALDRNFDVAWDTTKVYSSCSQMYPGPTPFSEAETKAVRDVFHQYGHKIVAYIHVHAGTHSAEDFKGEAVLYPRGFTEIQSDDDKYIDMKGEIDEAMKNASFQVTSVTVDTLHNWYGKVSGTSVDYASTVYGIPYALEFVMQIYENSPYAANADEMVDFNALTAIWQRVIDVVMTNILRNQHVNDVL